MIKSTKITEEMKKLQRIVEKSLKKCKKRLKKSIFGYLITFLKSWSKNNGGNRFLAIFYPIYDQSYV